MSVRIKINNANVVAYINHMGSSKSEQLNNLAAEIWNWCMVIYAPLRLHVYFLSLTNFYILLAFFNIWSSHTL